MSWVANTIKIKGVYITLVGTFIYLIFKGIFWISKGIRFGLPLKELLEPFLTVAITASIGEGNFC